MQKSLTLKIMLIQTITFFSYLICLYINIGIAKETLSSLCIAMSAGIIMYSYIQMERSTRDRTWWLAIFFGYVFWIVRDILVALYEYRGINPNETVALIAVSLGTSLFFMIGTSSFTVTYYKNRNKWMLFIDMSAAIILISILVCQVFFYNRVGNTWDFSLSDILITVSILLNTFTTINNAIGLSFIRKATIPICFRIISSGFLLYSLANIINAFFVLSGIGSFNSIITVLYMISLMAVAMGVFIRIYNQNFKIEQVDQMDKMGLASKLTVLLQYPVIALLINYLVHNKFFGNEMIGFLVVMVCYCAAHVCIYNHMRTQKILQKETELRNSLQNAISNQMQELNKLANEDSITKLYNRYYFMEKLNKEIGKRKQNEIILVMMIDINRFKAINDIYGYYVGDMVLKEMADRMKQWDTIGATIARYGEDEFTLLKRGEIHEDQIKNLTSSLIECISKPIMIDGNDLQVSVSVGVSVCPTYANESNVLIRYADIAMYRAKTSGINKCVYFDPVLSEFVRKKNELCFLLEKAVKESNFMVYYQPQFNLPGIELAGAEALIRWKDEKYGFIPPSEFIPIAEELGIIKEMDSWVCRAAFLQVAKWNRKYGIDLRMGINISPKELADDDFINVMNKNMEASYVEPQWTNIEITESIVLEDGERMDKIFEFFTSRGIMVSVDDFGTGYSSISYLKKYPFSWIKIDKSLIDKIVTSEGDRKIVSAVIAMSKSINMRTIAEGVETREQLDILIDFGCDQVQGFMFGRPVPADQFEEKYLCGLMKNN